jgi:hypothetical protein
MISHANIMANALQYSTFDTVARKKFGVKTQAVLGLLPFSHIYGLVVICYSNAYRGDSTIVLPKFELDSFLGAVQKHKIEQLYLVSSPHSQLTVSSTLTTPGPTDRYPDHPQPRRLQKVRPHLCPVSHHRCRAPRSRNGRGGQQAIPQVAHRPSLWHDRDLHRSLHYQRA